MASTSTEAPIKIDQGALVAHYKRIDPMLKEATLKGSASSQGGALKAAHAVATGKEERKLSLLLSAAKRSEAGGVLLEGINRVYLGIRTGLALGIEVSDLFSKFSGLDTLRGERGTGAVREAEYYEKQNTAAVIQAFVTAAYVLHVLNDYESEKIESIVLPFEGLPPIDLSTPPQTRNSLTANFVLYLEDSGRVNSELEFVKMALLYFQALADEVILKVGSLKHTEYFTSKSYKLEGSDFVIHGFELQHLSTTTVEFTRVEWGDIVGNAAAKHAARRTIAALMCYDPHTGRNPLKDLGGFMRTTLAYGPPGTGKSLEIAAIATELFDRCEDLGIPFLFHPFPDTIVSTYQGGSAERAVEWFRPLQDKKRIIFAPIDDAENNLMDRSKDGVSAGVKEVIGVFLRMTEGAYAIDRGNTCIRLYTNMPETIERAVMSRVQGRAEMAGAVSPEDFMDQDHLGLMGPFGALMPNFISMRPQSYAYMSAQDVKQAIADAYKDRGNPKTEPVRQLIKEATERFKGKRPHDFFAFLDTEMHKRFKYTSRDKRNIQSAVKSRLFDFDFPDEWMKDPEAFFKKDYDTKKKMIIDLMQASLKGKFFEDILFEETVFYFDNFVQIADTRFARDVEEARYRVRVAEAARKTT